MDQQGANIEFVLSIIFLVFNTIFILTNIYMFKLPKKSTKPLKIRLLILLIIDTIKYFSILFNLYFGEGVYYYLINCGIQVFQIYLFISLFKLTTSLIKKKNQYFEGSMPPFQYACFSFILIFPYHKIFNVTPEILITVQNVISIFVIYIFYKLLYNSLSSIKANINKKYVKKQQIAKNLNFGLNMSLGLLILYCIINIVLILFLDKDYQEFLSMPLDLIIYLKYFNYSVYVITIIQFEKIQTKKNSDDNIKILN